MPCRFLFLWPLALLLGACSEPPTPSQAAAPAVIAIARGHVDVEGGLRRISAARAGRIERWLLDPGASVSAGQPLLQLDSAEARLALTQAEAELALQRAKTGVRRALLPAAEQRARRLVQAAEAGLGARQEADDAQAALAELRAQLQAEQAAEALAHQKIAQARQNLAAMVVASPLAGVLLERQAQVGDMVAAGQALQQLLPALPQVVVAELGEGFAAKVRVGMRAEVQAASAQGPTQTARVLRLGASFRAARALDDSGQAPGDQRVLEAVLALEGGELKVGQRVLVRFLP